MKVTLSGALSPSTIVIVSPGKRQKDRKTEGEAILPTEELQLRWEFDWGVKKIEILEALEEENVKMNI